MRTFINAASGDTHWIDETIFCIYETPDFPEENGGKMWNIHGKLGTLVVGTSYTDAPPILPPKPYVKGYVMFDPYQLPTDLGIKPQETTPHEIYINLEMAEVLVVNPKKDIEIMGEPYCCLLVVLGQYYEVVYFKAKTLANIANPV